MNINAKPPSTKRPRWDGHRLLFEIEVAGKPVSCAISRAALEEVSGYRYIQASDLLRRFAGQRDRINEIAAGIFAIRPDNVTGVLNIWADDINDPPPAAPIIAKQMAQLVP
jgi:hypothetical protein